MAGGGLWRKAGLGSFLAVLFVVSGLEAVSRASSLPPFVDLPLSVTQKQGIPERPPAVKSLPPGARGFRDQALEPVRGMTIGPIESELQPGRGYGSAAFDQTLAEVQRMGGNWISLTVFARVWDLRGTGVALDFEMPHAKVRENVKRSVEMAHRRGLRVLLVPHLWVENGAWRAEIAPEGKERVARFDENYARFSLAWAEVAEESGVDLFAAGVELRSWVTTARAPSFVKLLGEIRTKYSGLLTYASNWDDAEDTVIWGHVDVIGINAFYPLHWEDDATFAQVEAGGHRVAEQVATLARRFERPVVFTEFGYTTRKNTAIKPWLWPEQLGKVEVDQVDQARAYSALLGAMRHVPGFMGAFVWRMYADVADMSQEAEWGFSPWGKQSEVVLRQAFRDERFGDPPLFSQPAVPPLLE